MTKGQFLIKDLYISGKKKQKKTIKTQKTLKQNQLL